VVQRRSPDPAPSPPEVAPSDCGRFYVVGMGPCPDLITLRGAEALRRADLIVVEPSDDLAAWAPLLGETPILCAPHGARAFYGTAPESLADPLLRAQAARNETLRTTLAATLRAAVEAGSTVAHLQSGDPLAFGNLYLLEMLAPFVPCEVIPGVSAYQAALAALQRSPVYGWDTSSAILTAADWSGRSDANERLMAAQTSMVFFTMGLDYPRLFAQLGRAYAAETPVAVVSHAGHCEREQVVRSTVGTFLAEVDWEHLPWNEHMLFVGKFLVAGQARKDGAVRGRARVWAPRPPLPGAEPS